MDSEKKMRFGDAWKIQLRAMKDIHRLDRWLLPSIALEKIVSAITPFVLIYFSSRCALDVGVAFCGSKWALSLAQSNSCPLERYA